MRITSLLRKNASGQNKKNVNVMTNKKFSELMEQVFADCSKISKAKGVDYTRGSIDALANFKTAGSDVDVGSLKICWIFMNKHYSAITNYVKTGGQSESEPISERIKDMINYLVLLQGLITESNESKSTGEPG